MATPTPQMKTDLINIMAGIWHQNTSDGKVDIHVNLTQRTWNNIVNYWPEIYLNDAVEIRILQPWYKKLIGFEDKVLVAHINQNELERIRKSWSDGKCFMLNGYMMIVKDIL